MSLIEVAFVATVLVVAGGIVALIHTASRRAGRAARRDALVAAAAIAAWLALTGILAAAGVTSLAAGPQRFMPIVLTATLVPLVLLLGTATGRRLADAAPPGPVIALQAFRIPVELVLWQLFVAGALPVEMSFEGRNLDVLTGATALPAAWLLYGGGRRLGAAALAWHLAGLALLVNIVSIAIRAMPGPLHSLDVHPTNTLVGTAPWIWLPTFLVPAAFWLHAAGLRHARAALRGGAPLHSQG